MPTLLSIKEAADRLGVSETTVRRMIAEFQLPARKIRGIWRIAPSDLESASTVNLEKSL